MLTQANKFLQDPATEALCLNKNEVHDSYVDKMLARNDFKVKSVKKRTSFTVAEIAEKAQNFHTILNSCLSSVVAVLNFDEVPCSLAGSMGAL